MAYTPKTTRELLVNSMTRGTTPMVTSKVSGKITHSSYFQQKAISRNDILKVYGTAEEFMESYKSFQNEYFKALETDLNITKGRSVNIGLMKRQGKIDLSVLNDEAAKRLEDMYKAKVLKVPDLLKQVGLPSVEIPSGNLYRGAYKFEVELGDELVHPVQLLLSRSVMNFNPDKMGLASVSFGRQNLFSASALERTYMQGERGLADVFGAAKGLKIRTLDVETTGVFSGSQVRSMAMAEMTVDDIVNGVPVFSQINPLDEFNIGFKNAQMGGLTVRNRNGAVQSIFEHIAGTELKEGKQLLDMGPGGANFLDEAEKFLNGLLQADRIAGHNVRFDIDALTDTIMGQSGFANHTGVQTALKSVYDRIDQGNYLIDTLDSTRLYLQKQVQDLVDSQGITDIEQRSKLFVKNLFAEEVQARVHIGGSASYASVENIALNTNLFELIEKDGQAEELFKLITKGSHIADTDTYLQSYIAKYQQTGDLKILGLSTDNISDFGRVSRARTLQASAITPTTSIADVQHLSDTVFNNLLTDRKMMQGVTVRSKAAALGIGSNNMPESGILQYFTAGEDLAKIHGIDQSGFYFVTREGSPTLVDETLARNEITRTLRSARANTPNLTISVGDTVGRFNEDALNILDTGFNFGQASAINELDHIRHIRIAAPELAKTEDIADVFKSMYKTMGAPMNIAPGGYKTGLGNYAPEFAKNISTSLAAIGDPYAFISMQDRTFSSIIARTTAQIASESNAASVRGVQLGIESITANPKLTANLGFSTFYSQKTARLFSSTAGETLTVAKPIVPLKVLQETLKDQAFGPNFAMKELSLSVAEIGNTQSVNVVWNAGRQLNKDQAKTLAEKLFENMGDKSQVARMMGVEEKDLHTSITKTVNNISAIKAGKNQEQAIDQLADLLMRRGVVVGSAGEQSAEVIAGLRAAGMETNTDVLLGQKTAAMGAMGEDTFTIGPFVDKKTVQSTEHIRLMARAEELVDINGTKVSRGLLDAAKIADTIGQDAGEARKILGQMERIAAGKTPNSMLDFYNKFKPHVGYGVAAVAALGTGYYVAKKHRERQLYDETLEAQPTERARTVDNYNSDSPYRGNLNSVRRDPLATAGVVGNLNRRSINHYNMSKDRYNHLYGG